MAVPGLVSTAQWTADRLFGALRDIQNRAALERSTIASNRARIAQLERDLGRIPGPPAPGAWNPLAGPRQRQAAIESTYARGTKQFSDFAARVQAFLNQHGVTASGLSGLGSLGLVPIIVPVALVAGALIALAVVNWLHDANSAQNKALSVQEQALRALLAGQITDTQYQATLASAESVAKQKMPKGDPVGLGALADALVPLGIVAAVLVLGPPLLKLVSHPSGSSRRRAFA